MNLSDDSRISRIGYKVKRRQITLPKFTLKQNKTNSDDLKSIEEIEDIAAISYADFDAELT